MPSPHTQLHSGQGTWGVSSQAFFPSSQELGAVKAGAGHGPLWLPPRASGLAPSALGTGSLVQAPSAHYGSGSPGLWLSVGPPLVPSLFDAACPSEPSVSLPYIVRPQLPPAIFSPFSPVPEPLHPAIRAHSQASPQPVCQCLGLVLVHRLAKATVRELLEPLRVSEGCLTVLFRV